MANLKSLLEGVRSELYPAIRNKVVTTALDLGGASTGQSGKQLLHTGGNKALTHKIAAILPFLPAEVAAGIADNLYTGNEIFTGGLALATGRPFFSDYGFRGGDLVLNAMGQNQAVAEINAERAKQRKGIRPEDLMFRGVE
jgi:hypothetical protein